MRLPIARLRSSGGDGPRGSQDAYRTRLVAKRRETTGTVGRRKALWRKGFGPFRQVAESAWNRLIIRRSQVRVLPGPPIHLNVIRPKPLWANALRHEACLAASSVISPRMGIPRSACGTDAAQMGVGASPLAARSSVYATTPRSSLGGALEPPVDEGVGFSVRAPMILVQQPARGP